MTSIAVVVEGWLPARSEVATPRNKLQTTPKVGDLVEYQGRLLRVWGVRPRRPLFTCHDFFFVVETN